MDTKIAQDQRSIQALTCPVCSMCTAERHELKDKLKSLRQHIARAKDPQHRLWCTLNWRIHFVRGGYRFEPRQHTIEEVIELVEKFFGAKLACKLQQRSQAVEEVEMHQI
jgi:hypothetical protein